MKYLILMLMIASSLSSNSQRNHYRMSSSINCLKTTESGEDEIYILIVWKTSYGLKGIKRVPVTSDHFSINDNDQDINAGSIISTAILDFDLAPNENIEIFYSLMEQDDGTTGQYNEIVEKLLKAFGSSNFANTSPAFYKSLMSNVASKYNLNNSDDWIGAFTDKISINSNGSWGERTTKLDNANNAGSTPFKPTVSPKSSTYEFTGDGSHYFVSFSLEKK